MQPLSFSVFKSRSIKKPRRQQPHRRLGIIETLESRAAPNESFSLLLGWGGVAELLPLLGPPDPTASAEMDTIKRPHKSSIDAVTADSDRDMTALLSNSAPPTAENLAGSASVESALPLTQRTGTTLVATGLSTAVLDHLMSIDRDFNSLASNSSRAAGPIEFDTPTAPAGSSTSPTASSPPIGQAGSIGGRPSALSPSASNPSSGSNAILTARSNGGGNSAPVAGDDVGFTAAGQTVTLYVTGNDSDPDFDSLTIESVTDPANGTASHDGQAVYYTPDPGFVSGVDTFEYTIGDGNGGSDTATVTMNMVEVTDYVLEWKQPDDSWVTVGESDISWSHDELRWTAIYSPSVPASHVEIDWLHTPWEDRDDPQASWSSFAYIDCDCPAEGNPGAGDWAIRPEITFDEISGQTAQTAFVATMLNAQQKMLYKIQSIEWVGVEQSDGESNLTNDNPASMGDGWRIFPGKNSLDENAPTHRAVEVKVTITPVMEGITVHLKLIDADDPTDADGPIDEDPNTSDNFGSLPSFPASAETDENGVVRKTIVVGLNPGDNYRMIVAPRAADLSDFKALNPPSDPNDPNDQGETKGRLYKDSNGNGNFDQGEPILDEANPVAPVHSSPLLTVWRRLNVEVDSMGTPPAGTNFDADDLLRGDVADPDTSALDAAFNPAFVDVEILPAAPNGPSENDLPFETNFANPAAIKNYFLGNNGHRQTKNEDQFYWTAYVAGIYEGVLGELDNDPDTEVAVMTYHQIVEGMGNDEPEYGAILMEVIRDVAAQHNWAAEKITHVQQAVVVAEIGSQFELEYTEDQFPRHVMADYRTDENEGNYQFVVIKFRESDIEKIRKLPNNPAGSRQP